MSTEQRERIRLYIRVARYMGWTAAIIEFEDIEALLVAAERSESRG